MAPDTYDDINYDNVDKELAHWIQMSGQAEQGYRLASRLQVALRSHAYTKDGQQVLGVVEHASLHLARSLADTEPMFLYLVSDEDGELLDDLWAGLVSRLKSVPSAIDDARQGKRDGSVSDTLLLLEEVEDGMGAAASLLSRKELMSIRGHLRETPENQDNFDVIDKYLGTRRSYPEPRDTFQDIVAWCAFLPSLPNCGGAAT